MALTKEELRELTLLALTTPQRAEAEEEPERSAPAGEERPGERQGKRETDERTGGRSYAAAEAAL